MVFLQVIGEFYSLECRLGMTATKPLSYFMWLMLSYSNHTSSVVVVIIVVVIVQELTYRFSNFRKPERGAYMPNLHINCYSLMCKIE